MRAHDEEVLSEWERVIMVTASAIRANAMSNKVRLRRPLISRNTRVVHRAVTTVGPRQTSG